MAATRMRGDVTIQDYWMHILLLVHPAEGKYVW